MEMTDFVIETEEDWPAHPHRRQLLALDEAARCAICCEFFDTPMALPCGHSFCSHCIRGNFRVQEQQGSPKCPHCRAACDARDLRANPALKDLVLKFLAAGPPKDSKAHFLDCPVCGKQIHHTLVNMHLDECLSGGGAAAAASTKPSKPARGSGKPAPNGISAGPAATTAARQGSGPNMAPHPAGAGEVHEVEPLQNKQRQGGHAPGAAK
ncbi:hypothetical protein WJX84_002683, partial [Apatococcus fuscideae]